jgi:hypothetical protein
MPDRVFDCGMAGGFVRDIERDEGGGAAAASIAATAAADFSALRAAIASLAPAAASPCAMPSPMPPLPPVTSATRPERSKGVMFHIPLSAASHWLEVGRASFETPAARAFRMTFFLNAIQATRHPEECPKGASRRAQDANATAS